MSALQKLQGQAVAMANLLYDLEPDTRPRVTLRCTLGASRGTSFPVVFVADEVRHHPKRVPCNDGTCSDRRCPAFANWTDAEIAAHFRMDAP